MSSSGAPIRLHCLVCWGMVLSAVDCAEGKAACCSELAVVIAFSQECQCSFLEFGVVVGLCFHYCESLAEAILECLDVRLHVYLHLSNFSFE